MPIGIGVGISPVLQPYSTGVAAASPLLTDLISYWKLDEVGGVRADSVTTTGNDLTDNNTVGSAAGVINLAGNFIRANVEYLSRANNASLSLEGTQPFSFSFWVRLNAVGTRYETIGKWLGGGGAAQYLIRLTAANTVMLRLNTTVAGIQTIVQGGVIAATTWYHIVITYDAASPNSTGSIYINNAAPVTNSIAADTVVASISPFQLGSRGDASNTVDGRIDETGFWKRELTAVEVSQLYNGGSGLSYPFS